MHIIHPAMFVASDADERWLRWLRRELETLHLEGVPFGRLTLIQNWWFRSPTVPLGTARGIAEISGTLVVLCSETSARDLNITEIVRWFRWKYSDRLVLPVMVADHSATNPPAVFRYDIDADGGLTDYQVLAERQVLPAVDLRHSGDGKALGLARIISAFTCVPIEEVLPAVRRARFRRVRNRVIAAVVPLLIAAVIVARFGLAH
jgi:hypothetical protein